MRRDLILFGILAVVLTVLGVTMYFAYRTDEEGRARLTAETPAVITEVYVVRERNNDTARPGRINSVRVSYQYSVDGRQHARTTSLSRNVGMNFTEGVAAKVCYNPINPEEAELFEMNRPCGR